MAHRSPATHASLATARSAVVLAADPFLQADTALAHELRADGARLTFHVWPGKHGGSYWHRHIGQYLRFYAIACAS